MFRKAIRRELKYAIQTIMFYRHLRRLDAVNPEQKVARIATGTQAAEAVSALHGLLYGGTVQPEEPDPDDVFAMDADEYERYLAKREGRPE